MYKYYKITNNNIGVKMRKYKNKRKIIIVTIIIIICIINIYLKIVTIEKTKIENIFNKINVEKNYNQQNYNINDILIEINNLETVTKQEFNKIVYIRLLLIIFIILFNIILIYDIYQNNKIQKYKNNIYKDLIKMNKFRKEFKKGLNNRQFKIYIQPKYDTLKEKIVGGELLVRWHKENKIIYPNEFIQKLEEYNLIEQLDLYLLDNICRELEKWKDTEKISDIKISLNQSQKNLLNKNYIYKFKEIIKKYNFKHELLEIELTENIFIQNKEIVKKFEKEIHDLNLKIAIDDFGTGYSSYNLLSEIEIDTLKLDKKLFENLDNIKARVIINAIINMTKKLNIESVAEGIEKREQLNYLKKVKCNQIQGYYFSKPKLIESFEEEIIRS